MKPRHDTFNTFAQIKTQSGAAGLYRLDKLADQLGVRLEKMPFSLRILLENLLRHCDGRIAGEADVKALANWRPGASSDKEIAFMPARVVLQDFTGVPCVVDLAAMRSAMVKLGGDPKKINPLVPVDLVIDHSVQVDFFGTTLAFQHNVEREFERNDERYQLLRWAQKAFNNFSVVPPGTGIVHQVNLEYLGKVVQLREQGGVLMAYPDTLVGTDSHTTMINGLGVLGWGVGGIEAEAVMLGQPYFMLTPEVVGFRLTGQLPEGATPTDLVLTVTQMLRKHGVVGKFVEFYGPGLSKMGLADRATIGNMSPEYGATMGFFPVDEQTLAYLRGTGRPAELVDLVERYTKEQGLFRTDDSPEPEYDDHLELDMSTVVPSVAGPVLPQDRVPLAQVKASFKSELSGRFGKGEAPAAGGGVAVATRAETELQDGNVVIAAITSCTNTSNPTVMVAAGLVAKKAVERGLDVKPYVKTSLAPGSRVVTDYLTQAGLLPFLEALRFHVVGYGCTTCIGNSGNVAESIANQVKEHNLVVASVLSGNRNFEGRINPVTRANYLASPPLVVAFALAGRVDIDFETEPLGNDPNGDPVYLRDVWPSQQEVRDCISQSLKPEMYADRYAEVFEGDERWRNLPTPEGDLYDWNDQSTYIQEPPFFADVDLHVPDFPSISGARVLALFGNSITTDH
ncbi:MAG TPA: aconitate hydratase AcnA, partial [Limnochordia bacterium]|nr:aconitate hydratase AcnA [Limnochordia bacterium]